MCKATAKSSKVALIQVFSAGSDCSLLPKVDFIAKMQIALKEANETGYWLELLYNTEYITESQYKELDTDCKSLLAMLVSSINTAKNSLNKD